MRVNGALELYGFHMKVRWSCVTVQVQTLQLSSTSRDSEVAPLEYNQLEVQLSDSARYTILYGPIRECYTLLPFRVCSYALLEAPIPNEVSTNSVYNFYVIYIFMSYSIRHKKGNAKFATSTKEFTELANELFI